METKRRPRRLADVAVAVAVGVFCTWALFQSFVNHSGWQLSTSLVALVVAGAILCPVAVALTGLSQRLARPSEDFWGGGVGTRLIVMASLYGCASIAWGIAMISLFGTAPTAP